MSYTMKKIDFNMTTNQTFPYVVKDSISSSNSFRAFDGKYLSDSGIDTFTDVRWYIKQTKGWISIDVGEEGKKIGKYALFPRATNSIESPKNWTFEGSDNDTEWTILDEKVNQTLDVNGNTYEIENTHNYRYYRLNISSNNGSATYTTLVEIELYEITTQNKTFILHDGEYKRWNPRIPTGELVPVMTSDTSPSGQVLFNSLFDSSRKGYYLFDKNQSTNYHPTYADVTAGTAYVGYDFKKDTIVNGVRITSYSIPSATIRYFDIEGWSGSAWIKIQENCDIGEFSSTSETKDYYFENNKPYTKYRLSKINSTNPPGSLAGVVGMNFLYEPNNDSSNKWTAVSTTPPDSAQFLEHGMDNLSPLIDRKVTELEPMAMVDRSEILVSGEVGKVFSKTIDLKKYLDIRKIEIGG